MEFVAEIEARTAGNFVSGRGVHRRFIVPCGKLILLASAVTLPKL